MFQSAMSPGGGMDKKAGDLTKMPDNVQEKPGLKEGEKLDSLIRRMNMSGNETLRSSDKFTDKVADEVKKTEPKLHLSSQGAEAFGGKKGFVKDFYSEDYLKELENKELAEGKGKVENADVADKTKDEAEIKKSEILFSAIEGKIDKNFKDTSPDWKSLNEKDQVMFEWIQGMNAELHSLGLSQEEIKNFFTNKTFSYLLTGVDLNPMPEKDQKSVESLREAIGNFYKNPDGTLKNNAILQETVDDNTKIILGKISEFSPKLDNKTVMKYAGYEMAGDYKPVGNSENIDQYQNLNQTQNVELKNIFNLDPRVKIQDSYYDLQMNRTDGLLKMDPNQGELFKWLNKLVNFELPKSGIAKGLLRNIFLNKNYENLLIGTGSKLENTDLLNVYNMENDLRKQNLPQVEDIISKMYLLVGNLHGSSDLTDRMTKYKAGAYNSQLAN